MYCLVECNGSSHLNCNPEAKIVESKTASKRDYLNITTLYSTKWKVPLAGFASSWKEMDPAKVRESRSPTSTLEPSLQWQVKHLVQWDVHFSNMESPFQLQQQHQHYVVLMDKHNLLENPTSCHCKKWNAVESKNLSLKHASENNIILPLLLSYIRPGYGGQWSWTNSSKDS